MAQHLPDTDMEVRVSIQQGVLGLSLVAGFRVGIGITGEQISNPCFRKDPYKEGIPLTLIYYLSGPQILLRV